MDEMLEQLVTTSSDGHVYVAQKERRYVRHKMEHLTCFVPGMLALGVTQGAVAGNATKAARYLSVAADVAETCWHMYDRQVSGLGPEIVTFVGSRGMRNQAAYNLLRPEAIEGFWYLWRATGDWKYREYGWAIFQRYQRHCRREAGYSGVKDVRDEEPEPDDTQQSFFLAETLKYLWLLFRWVGRGGGGEGYSWWKLEGPASLGATS